VRIDEKLALIVAGLLLAVAVPVLAHHSFSEEFDLNKPVTLKGVVTKIEWMISIVPSCRS
jgi:hypothetical protein